MRAGMTVAAFGAAATLLAPARASAQAVDEIVARHLAARGGREALAAVKTLRMSGHATAGPGREAIVRREIARPGKIRTEFVFQGTTGVYAFDGSKGWRVSPLDGSLDAEPLPDDEAAASAEQADIEGPLVDWKAKGHKVELLGKASLPGGPADELKVTLKSGAVRRVFVDAASGFIVRVESTRRVRGHDVALETDFGDYRKVDGVAFPHSIEGSARGRPNRLRIVVDSVEVNPRIDESRFKMPR
jgi:outer membrane lipoprotein-sorting protein